MKKISKQVKLAIIPWAVILVGLATLTCATSASVALTKFIDIWNEQHPQDAVTYGEIMEAYPDLAAEYGIQGGE